MLIKHERVKIFLKFLGESVAGPKLGTSSEQLLTPLAAAGLFEVQTADYHCFTDQVLRVLKVWPPEYISCCHPFVSCLILGPAAIHARVIKHDKLDQGSNSREQSEVDMKILKLALSHLARAWKFGALIVGKLACTVFQSWKSSLNFCLNRSCRLCEQGCLEKTLTLLRTTLLDCNLLPTYKMQRAFWHDGSITVFS
jgi:hypothetical protein